MFEKTGRKCTEHRPAFDVKKILFVCILILMFLLIFQNYEYISNCSCSRINKLDICPIRPPNLIGRFNPDVSSESLESVEKRFESVLELGGYYKPKKCRARDRVAFLVTCRGQDREEQLVIFLKNLHPILMRQQLEYQIFVLNQTKDFWFNKGALYNTGFVEAMKIAKFDCLIFHDVDMIPMDDRNIYDCPRVNPRHMAIDVDKYNFTLLRSNYSGGVFVLTPDQYERINGHPNTYWGWGGEDNDVHNRVRKAGYFLERYPHEVTRYKTLPHKGSRFNPNWWKHMMSGKERFNTDGLNSLKYHLRVIEKKRSFTHILVHFIPEELSDFFHVWNNKQIIFISWETINGLQLPHTSY